MDTEKTVRGFSKRLLPIWATIPLYILTSIGLMVLIEALIPVLLTFFPSSSSVYYCIGKQFIVSLVTLAGIWMCTFFFLTYLDGDSVRELGMNFRNRWKDGLSGFIFAVVLYWIGFWVLLGLDVLAIDAVHADFGVLAGTFLVFLVLATIEEIMVRGYIQGRLMNRMNRFVALVIASLIFAALHIFNPYITLFSFFNLFLAGLLLGASYMYTRNLCFPILLHTTWNWMQGPVLGYGVSGTDLFPSVFTLSFPEENIMNGGKFGFEGSIICTALMLLGTALIIGWYERKERKRIS